VSYMAAREYLHVYVILKSYAMVFVRYLRGI
jgi:hypothetical protein